jgi:hypothetical protein
MKQLVYASVFALVFAHNVLSQNTLQASRLPQRAYIGRYATVKLPTQTEDTSLKVPFAFADFTWMNGQNRQKEFPLTNKYGVASLVVDAYYNYNFANPIDNTQTISSTVGRTGEFTLNLVSVGYEVNYKNVIGRVLLQTGAVQNIIQFQDGTVGRGRNLSAQSLAFVREAVAGYHFDKWYGINIEAGIFMSYVGLESYVMQENWLYQRSLVCDFTPFYFSGMRVQFFPTKNLKIEPWLINGWQTYGKYNQAPGVGNSVYFRPKEYLAFVANLYYGYESRENPARVRFHHDNSLLVRYVNNPSTNGLSKAAFSLNSHYGFQSGGGARPDVNFMTGTSFVNRLWFQRNTWAWTNRVEVIANPGRYLAFTPAVGTNSNPDGYYADPNNPNDTSLRIWGFTSGIDIMPSDFFTFRAEYTYRNANIAYFAGPGGTTSPSGWADAQTASFVPDLRTSQQQIILSTNFRF